MTVKEYAEKHRNEVLYLMTPVGYLNTTARHLLAKETMKTNPGCSGCDMKIDTEFILQMTILDTQARPEGTAILVE